MLVRILKLLLALIFYILNRGSILLWSLWKRTWPGTLVVLMYHSVKPEQRNVFEHHMKALLNTGFPAGASPDSPLKKDRHHIAVTFDDGFQSFAENALPVLVALNLPATCFVPTGYLGQKPGWIRDPGHACAGETVMTEDQLRQLPEHLITIGSHGVTHLRLAEIGLEKARGEMVESKRTLERILDKPVTLLSFPHGSHDDAIAVLARQVGYERVFLNVPTFPASDTCGYLIGRIDISLDDWPLEYRLKLAGAYQWLPLAMRVKHELARTLNKRMRTKI